MNTDGPFLTWFSKVVFVLQKLRLPMWYGLLLTSVLVLWWTHWLLEQGNFLKMTDWQLAVIPTIYLGLIPIIKLAVEHSERGINKDPD